MPDVVVNTIEKQASLISDIQFESTPILVTALATNQASSLKFVAHRREIRSQNARPIAQLASRLTRLFQQFSEDVHLLRRHIVALANGSEHPAHESLKRLSDMHQFATEFLGDHLEGTR